MLELGSYVRWNGDNTGVIIEQFEDGSYKVVTGLA